MLPPQVSGSPPSIFNVTAVMKLLVMAKEHGARHVVSRTDSGGRIAGTDVLEVAALAVLTHRVPRPGVDANSHAC
jgi:hypothetical protein